MSNKEYKIEVIDAPTNEVIEKDTGGESWWYKNIGTPINESDRQIAKEKASISRGRLKAFTKVFFAPMTAPMETSFVSPRGLFFTPTYQALFHSGRDSHVSTVILSGRPSSVV